MIFRSPYPRVEVPEVSFSSFVFANLAHWTDRPAFIDGISGRELTHGQVHDGAQNVAAALAQRGLRKGDVLAIVCPNVLEYAICFHGVALGGGVITTANPLSPVEDLAAQLSDSHAKFVLTVPAALDTVHAAAEGLGVQEIFVLGEADGATPFSSLMEVAGATLPVSMDCHDLLMMPYSSGTTGRAKGVMLTHYNAVAMLAQLEPLAPDVSGRVTLAVLPFFHCYGMQALMNGTLRRGTTCVTMPRFDTAQFLSLVQDYRVTTLFLVPPIVLALAKSPLVDEFDLSSLATVTSGAAPLGVRCRRMQAGA